MWKARQLQVLRTTHERVRTLEGRERCRRAWRNHGREAGTLAVFCRHGLQDIPPHARLVGGLKDSENHAQIKFAGEAPEHIHFIEQRAVIRLRPLDVTKRIGGDGLQDGVAARAHAGQYRSQFVLPGEGTWHIVSGSGFVDRDAGGGESNGSRGRRLLGNLPHLPEVIGVRRFRNSAVAHH